MALSPTGKRISALRELDLDATALEGGQTIDLRTEREIAGLPANARSERPDLPPGIPLAVAQHGRRISPMVTGRRAIPTQITRIDESQLVNGQVRSTRPPAPAPQLPRAPSPAPAVRPVGTQPARAALPVALPNAKSRNTVGSLVVQLGRFGDIINILPLLAEEARLVSRPIKLMVAEEFASLLDGVSYVHPVIFKGTYHELDRAWKQALTLDPQARCSQVHVPGKDFPRKEDSFARDSWRRLGASGRWEQAPLYFDRRDRERENALADQFDWSKPTVLVSLGAASFPFPHTERVTNALQKWVSEKHPEVQIVDISNTRAERIYDLLGLFDRATVLITADTATQHLANASSIPVIAFRVSEPWFGSPRRANHILNRRYSDIDMREVTRTLDLAIANPVKGDIYHVSPAREFESFDERVVMAQGTWHDWDSKLVAALDTEFPRNSQTRFNDPIPTSFMLDIIEKATLMTKKPDDIVLFTNSDVGFSDTAIKNVRRICMLKGACYGYRFDHERIVTPLDHFDTVNATCAGGLDLFAFTKRWLGAHAWRLPDMLLGRTGWDLVFRDVVRKTGGGEVYGAIWHENHPSWWKQNFQTPGNEYNTTTLKNYRARNDVTRPYDR